MRLMPFKINEASGAYAVGCGEKYDAMDCMGCGCCSFICPANKPLAQSIRLAKDQIAAKTNGRKEEKSNG